MIFYLTEIWPTGREGHMPFFFSGNGTDHIIYRRFCQTCRIADFFLCHGLLSIQGVQYEEQIVNLPAPILATIFPHQSSSWMNCRICAQTDREKEVAEFSCKYPQNTWFIGFYEKTYAEILTLPQKNPAWFPYRFAFRYPASSASFSVSKITRYFESAISS